VCHAPGRKSEKNVLGVSHRVDWIWCAIPASEVDPGFEPWSILRTYWPLILIFIGLGKIWDNVQRSRNPNQPPGISLGATFGAVAFVLVIAVLIWHGRGFPRRQGGIFNTKHTTKIVEPQRANQRARNCR